MTLREQLTADLKDAMKSGKGADAGALRLVIAAVQNREIADRTGSKPLADEGVLAVLRSEAKKRRDAIALYRDGNRPELAQLEETELALIGRYLPAAVSAEEIARVAQAVVAAGATDFGAAMRAAKEQLKGEVDGKVLADALRRALAK